MNSKANIHVLHVVPGLLAGGMELMLARIVSKLSNSDMRHSVACLTGEAVIANSFPTDTDIHIFHSRPNEPQLPWRLAQMVRKIRPSVIQAWNWGAWPDIAVARLFVSPLVPLIFSFHGSDTSPMPFRRRLACRILTPLTTYIHTISKGSKLFLVDEIGIPTRRIEVILNGIDTDEFSPTSRPATIGPLVIGTAGRLSAVKNQFLMIQSFAQVVRDGLNAELRLAGKGPMKHDLLQLAVSLGVKDRVLFADYVENMPDFLRAMDIFVLSSDSEGLPIALIEAMACELPCVATTVGGVSEVLDNGQAGLLVAPRDSAGMAQAMSELASKQDLRRLLGSRARQRVCERYGIQRMIEEYRGLYQRLSWKQVSRT